ncbi:MAG TPA: response regulator [Terriglobia bacterium]
MSPPARSEEGRVARILLVEGHAPLAAMRRAFLIQHGYEVVWARDGQEGCRLVQSEPFDLVVTDAELPKASGWEVAGLAKEHALPVILSSGWPLRLRREEVAARGVDLSISKTMQSGRSAHAGGSGAAEKARAIEGPAHLVRKSQYHRLHENVTSVPLFHSAVWINWSHYTSQ